MQQVQTGNPKSFLGSNAVLIGVVAGFAVAALLIGYLVYTGVSNFVARWNITDLPGMVVLENPQGMPQAPMGTESAAVPPPLDVHTGPEPRPWDGASRVNLLVMGLDYRDWATGEGAPRTDTMILFSMDPISKTAGILTIPRDLWVSMPGFEDPNRINVAYRFGETYDLPGGGPELAMKTVESLLGLPIDYFALIDFSAFERFIDEIGGVEIDVPRKLKLDPIEGKNVTLRPGRQALSGSLALAYARNRYTEGGDFDRSQRQMQVIEAIRRRVDNPQELARLLPRASAIYQELASGIKTNLSLDQAIQLAWLAQQIDPENIKRGVIGSEHITFGKSPEGDDVLKPRPEQIRILRDEVFTATGAASPALEGAQIEDLVKTENATIALLNGSGTAGLASRTEEYLKSLGLNVVSTGDAPEPYLYSTLISYKGKPYTIKYLGDLLKIEPQRIYNKFDPANPVDFVLYLGSDWANTNNMP